LRPAGRARSRPGVRRSGGGALPITSSQTGHLLDALARGYDVLGFGRVTGGDEVFRQLVLARIIEPASKLDSLRALEETALASALYATLKQRLRAYAKPPWRQRFAAACAACAACADLRPASLVLYDVSMLHFETDARTGPGRAGSPRSPPGTPDHDRAAHRRRRVPADGTRVRGQQAETKTTLPGHRFFMTAHQLPDITAVADTGMISERTRKRSRRPGCHSFSVCSPTQRVTACIS
jgi:hypothetical protein